MQGTAPTAHTGGTLEAGPPPPPHPPTPRPARRLKRAGARRVWMAPTVPDVPAAVPPAGDGEGPATQVLTVPTYSPEPSPVYSPTTARPMTVPARRAGAGDDDDDESDPDVHHVGRAERAPYWREEPIDERTPYMGLHSVPIPPMNISYLAVSAYLEAMRRFALDAEEGPAHIGVTSDAALRACAGWRMAVSVHTAVRVRINMQVVVMGQIHDWTDTMDLEFQFVDPEIVCMRLHRHGVQFTVGNGRRDRAPQRVWRVRRGTPDTEGWAAYGATVRQVHVPDLPVDPHPEDDFYYEQRDDVTMAQLFANWAVTTLCQMLSLGADPDSPVDSMAASVESTCFAYAHVDDRTGKPMVSRSTPPLSVLMRWSKPDWETWRPTFQPAPVVNAAEAVAFATFWLRCASEAERLVELPTSAHLSLSFNPKWNGDWPEHVSARDRDALAVALRNDRIAIEPPPPEPARVNV